MTGGRSGGWADGLLGGWVVGAKYPEISRNIPKYPETSRNIPKHPETFRNIPKHRDKSSFFILSIHCRINYMSFTEACLKWRCKFYWISSLLISRNIPKHPERNSICVKYPETSRNIPKHPETFRNTETSWKQTEQPRPSQEINMWRSPNTILHAWNIPKYLKISRNIPKHPVLDLVWFDCPL